MTTDFAPELPKEKADDARDGEKYTIEPPYLFNDNKGTTQTVNNSVANRLLNTLQPSTFVHDSTLLRDFTASRLLCIDQHERL